MIPIIIPAYEPDQRLIGLLKELSEYPYGPVILVNDGSGSAYEDIFKAAKNLLSEKAILLTHEVNRGKGRALKTAFQYILEHLPKATGAVTADSDGQHTKKSIMNVAEMILQNQGDLILGVRTFDKEDIPWKSRFGNRLTEKVFTYVAGVHISDTQTGLRGIPREFMKELLTISADRFEFETQMLLLASGQYKIREIPIETIYDSKEDHQTHFNPLKDSVKIYAVLGKWFLRYTLASFSSSIVDLLLFTILCHFLRDQLTAYVAVATVMARIISAAYNYTVNYKIVFKSRENMGKAAWQYALLAVVQMGMSALLATGGVKLLPFIPEVVTKAIVDTILFFASYHIQKKYVF